MFKRFGMLVAICCLLTAFDSWAARGDEPDDVVKTELKAMAGTWRPDSIQTDGKEAPGDVLHNVVMHRDESGKTVIRRGDMVVLEAMVKKLDPFKKPKTIDTEQTVGEHKGKIILGIYEIDGDALRVCVAPPGKERPAEFTAQAGSGNSLAVYRREK
jgi:uncharacterized protein (TIGR03067 family)